MAEYCLLTFFTLIVIIIDLARSPNGTKHNNNISIQPDFVHCPMEFNSLSSAQFTHDKFKCTCSVKMFCCCND